MDSSKQQVWWPGASSYTLGQLKQMLPIKADNSTPSNGHDLRLCLIFDLLATVHDMGSISCTYTNMTSIRGHPLTYYGTLSNCNIALPVMSVTTGRKKDCANV